MFRKKGKRKENFITYTVAMIPFSYLAMASTFLVVSSSETTEDSGYLILDIVLRCRKK